MRFGELCLLAVAVATGGVARADKVEEPAPVETPPVAEPEPTFGKPKTGPSQQEIDDMTPLPAPPEPKGVATGFAVGLELATSTVLSGQLGSSSKLGGAFWFGRRGPTVTWGVGFQFMRASQYDDSNQTSTNPALDQSYTTFIIEPSLSIVFARSRDLRTELLGRFVLGYGFSVFSDNNDLNVDPPDVEIIRFGLGPELRHWISDSFAIGAHVGPTWEHRGVQNSPGDGSTGTMTTSSWEVDGAISMTAVF
ncbi:MAG TPA: hypothetical protein VGM90_29915 [Kofleriaceae bacterium]|jgi:hypothetical protein